MLWAGGGLALVGLTAGITAGVLFFSAADHQQEGEQLEDRHLHSTYLSRRLAESAQQQVQDEYDQASQQRSLAWIASGGGALALGSAAWLIYKGLHPAPLAAPAAAARPAAAELPANGPLPFIWCLTPQPGGLALVGRF
ncbi:MAG: hypothetical protein FJ125_02295 [Deltaproteobacteria bacterium]|nr:hypothetical protein [Deltaproteobacteria bacterium]